jgi:aquaporin Z
MQKKLAAEFLGTFWLVFCGCGYVLFGPTFEGTTISMLGIGVTFGLTVLTMCYAVGNISGGHFNPAVSVGMVVAGRMPARDLIGYIIAQVVAGIVAGGVLYVIATGKDGGFTIGNFASNGYDGASPGHYSMLSVLIVEVIMTAFFIFVIAATTSPRAPAGFAPLAIGLTLTVIHLGSLPISGTSVNPARSTGTAIFADGPALGQLWLFWVAPIVGGIIGALVWKALFGDEEKAAA